MCNSNGDVVKIPRGRATLATIVAGITEGKPPHLYKAYICVWELL